MLSTSTSSENQSKSTKKSFSKRKNKPNNQTSNNASETTFFKFERVKNTKNNKNVNLNQITEEKNTNPFNGEQTVLSFQDFPELKTNNISNLNKFNGVYTRTEFNNLWGCRTKKNEASPIPTVKNDMNSEVTQSPIKDTTGLSEINLELLKLYLKDDGKEKEADSAKEFSAKSVRNPNKKKRADPVLINLGDIISRNKNKRKKERPQKVFKSKYQRIKGAEQLSGNFLDSSNPKRLRGKYREVKKEKVTNLKLAIIKERIMKQKLREQSIASFLGNENVNFIDSIDFKAEIKQYLKEQNERKSKQTTKNKENENNKNSNSQKNVRNNEKIIPLITPEGKFKFSSKFREYCDNIITPQLNSAISNLIKESVNLQDRAFLRDPVKAKARKRHVSGIREVRKYLMMKKVKLIVIAPNLENLQMEGSLHDLINELKAMALEQNVPYAFALDRYKIGRCTKKNSPVSAFAILAYEGIEELYHSVLDFLNEAKQQFSEITKPDDKKEENIKTAEINSKILASLISGSEGELNKSQEKNELNENSSELCS